jgi:hypothetical protein
VRRWPPRSRLSSRLRRSGWPPGACGSRHMVWLSSCPPVGSANSSAPQEPGASASRGTAVYPYPSTMPATADGLTSARVSRTACPAAQRRIPLEDDHLVALGRHRPVAQNDSNIARRARRSAAATAAGCLTGSPAAGGLRPPGIPMHPARTRGSAVIRLSRMCIMAKPAAPPGGLGAGQPAWRAKLAVTRLITRSSNGTDTLASRMRAGPSRAETIARVSLAVARAAHIPHSWGSPSPGRGAQARPGPDRRARRCRACGTSGAGGTRRCAC